MEKKRIAELKEQVIQFRKEVAESDFDDTIFLNGFISRLGVLFFKVIYEKEY